MTGWLVSSDKDIARGARVARARDVNDIVVSLPRILEGDLTNIGPECERRMSAAPDVFVPAAGKSTPTAGQHNENTTKLRMWIDDDCGIAPKQRGGSKRD
jgi:hypothetical protein